MSMFRKKPVVIEACQLDRANCEAIARWCGGRSAMEAKPSDPSDVAQWVEIPTLEGVMRAQIGDWVIRGVKGEFYPCKPDIFADTYEATHRTPCVDGDVCGESAHCPPADPAVGAHPIGKGSVSYDDFESFSEAEHGPVMIQDARFDPWAAFQTEDGDWLAVRARHEDDEPYSEHDPWRPVGPEEVEELRFPLRVAEVAQVFRAAKTPGEVV
jgi:hypothetical protein